MNIHAQSVCPFICQKVILILQFLLNKPLKKKSSTCISHSFQLFSQLSKRSWELKSTLWILRQDRTKQTLCISHLLQLLNQLWIQKLGSQQHTLNSKTGQNRMKQTLCISHLLQLLNQLWKRKLEAQQHTPHFNTRRNRNSNFSISYEHGSWELKKHTLNSKRRNREQQTYPVSHDTSPANDARFQPGVGLDVSAPQHCTPLDTHTILYDYIRADGHVGAYPAVVANLGTGVLMGP